MNSKISPNTVSIQNKNKNIKIEEDDALLTESSFVNVNKNRPTLALGIYHFGVDFYNGTSIPRLKEAPRETQEDFNVFCYIMSKAGWNLVGITRVASLYKTSMCINRIPSADGRRSFPVNEREKRALKNIRHYIPYTSGKCQRLLENLSRMRKSVATLQMFSKARKAATTVSVFTNLSVGVTVFSSHLDQFAKYIKQTWGLSDALTNVVWFVAFVLTIYLFHKLVMSVRFVLDIVFDYLVCSPIRWVESFFVKETVRTFVLAVEEETESVDLQGKGSNTLLYATMAAIGALVTGSTIDNKKVDNFVKGLPSYSSLIDATLGNLKYLLSWIAWLYDPTCALACDYDLWDKYENIRKRVAAHLVDPEFSQKLVLDKQLIRSVTEDRDFLCRNRHLLCEKAADPIKGREIQEVYNSLVILHTDALAAQGGESRPQPELIWLEGKPGQGKGELVSLITKLVTVEMRKREAPYWKDIQNDNALLFTKSPTSDYFDTYRAQPFCLFDDWCQVRSAPDIARSVGEIISLVNTVPAVLNMADCSSKNKYRFNSKVCYVTTNFTEFHTLPMTNLEALLRRISLSVTVEQTGAIPKDDTPITMDMLNAAWDLKVNSKLHGKQLPLVTERIVEIVEKACVAEELFMRANGRYEALCLPIETNFDNRAYLEAERGKARSSLVECKKRYEEYVSMFKMYPQRGDEQLVFHLTGLVKFICNLLDSKEACRSFVERLIDLQGWTFTPDPSCINLALKAPPYVSWSERLMNKLGWANPRETYIKDPILEHNYLVGCVQAIDDVYADHFHDGERYEMDDLFGNSTILDYDQWIRGVYETYGKSMNLAMCHYAAKYYYSQGCRALTYIHCRGGLYPAEHSWYNLFARNPIHLDTFKDYPNSMPATMKTRMWVYLHTGMDLSLGTIGAISAGLATMLTLLVAQICTYFSKPVPSWLQNKSSKADEINAMKGNGKKNPVRFQKRYNNMHRVDEVALQGKGDFCLAAKILRQSFVLEIVHFNGNVTYGRGVFLDNRTLATNWHTLDFYASKIRTITIYPDHPDTGVESGHVLSFKQFDYHRVDDQRDLGYVLLNRTYISGICDLWKHLPRRNSVPDKVNVERFIRGVFNGTVHMAKEGPFTLTSLQNKPRKYVISMNGQEYRMTDLEYYLALGGCGEGGDCGLPYIRPGGVPNPFVGLHMARSGDDSFIVPLYQEDRPEAFFQGFMPPGLEEKIDYEAPGVHIPGLIYCGKVDSYKPSAPPFSALAPIYHGWIDQYPREHVKLPAIMNSQALHTRNVATANIGKSMHCDFNVPDPSSFCKGFLPNTVRAGVLDTYTTIFGNDNIDSMASQSKYVGFFFMPRKKKELVNYETKYVDPDILKRVQDYEELAKLGPINPFVQQFAKDELLDRAKVETAEPQCRIINGHDLAYNIVLRKYFGKTLSQIARQWHKGSIALGLNPHSIDWQFVSSKVFQHRNIIGGDIKKEEATTTSFFSKLFADFIISRGDYTDVEANVVRNLAAGLDSYYLHTKNGGVYKTTRGHSSGHLLTFFYNSFVVWTALKILFLQLYPDEEFEKEVSLYVGGDDHLGSVSEKCDRFNMTYISKAMYDNFGIHFTTPSKKTAESPWLEDEEDLNFLGRAFCLSKGKILAPLRVSAMYNMQLYASKVVGMTKKEVIAVRTDAAFREWVLYGESRYNLERDKYLALFNNAPPNIRKLKPLIPTYEQNSAKVFSNWYKNDFSPDYSLLYLGNADMY